MSGNRRILMKRSWDLILLFVVLGGLFIFVLTRTSQDVYEAHTPRRLTEQKKWDDLGISRDSYYYCYKCSVNHHNSFHHRNGKDSRAGWRAAGGW